MMAASLSSLINDHAPAVTPLRCIRFADSWRLERETVWLATSSIATCTPRVLCDMIMNSRRRSSAITRRGPAAPRGRAGANRNLARLACSQSSEHTGMTGRTIAHKSGSLSGAHVLLGQNHTCVARRYKRTGRQNWHVKRSVLPRTLHMTEACGVFAVQFHATVTSQRIANITSCVWHAWL